MPRSCRPLLTKSLPFPLSSRRTRISYFTALTGAAYVVLLKENHMQSTEAATLDRKSGEADLSRRAVEGSAVPRTFRGNVFRPDRSVVERSAVSFFVLTHTLSLLRPYGPTQSRAQQSVKSFLLSLPSS